MARKKKIECDWSEEKILALAEKYHLEYEKVDDGEIHGHRFFLPTGYVEDIDSDGRDDLFSYYGDVQEEIGIYDSFTVNSSIEKFIVEYDESRTVKNMEELEQIVNHMTRCGAKWLKTRKEFEEEQALMKASEDFV